MFAFASPSIEIRISLLSATTSSKLLCKAFMFSAQLAAAAAAAADAAAGGASVAAFAGGGAATAASVKRAAGRDLTAIGMTLGPRGPAPRQVGGRKTGGLGPSSSARGEHDGDLGRCGAGGTARRPREREREGELEQLSASRCWRLHLFWMQLHAVFCSSPGGGSMTGSTGAVTIGTRGPTGYNNSFLRMCNMRSINCGGIIPLKPCDRITSLELR